MQYPANNAHIDSMEIPVSINIPILGGPSAEAKTVMATTNARILPRWAGPYNSAQSAVIPV